MTFPPRQPVHTVAAGKAYVQDEVVKLANGYKLNRTEARRIYHLSVRLCKRLLHSDSPLCDKALSL